MGDGTISTANDLGIKVVDSHELHKKRINIPKPQSTESSRQISYSRASSLATPQSTPMEELPTHFSPSGFHQTLLLNPTYTRKDLTLDRAILPMHLHEIQSQPQQLITHKAKLRNQVLRIQTPPITALSNLSIPTPMVLRSLIFRKTLVLALQLTRLRHLILMVFLTLAWISPIAQQISPHLAPNGLD